MSALSRCTGRNWYLAFFTVSLDRETTTQAWSSYDRTWFSGPDKQEIFIFIWVNKTKNNTNTDKQLFRTDWFYEEFIVELAQKQNGRIRQMAIKLKAGDH
jgi:hypothetical protein